MADVKGGTTKDVAGWTASLCIASDLGLHFYNYGVPPLSSQILMEDKGMQIIGTLTGVVTTAVVSGVTSDELEAVIDAMPEPYDRLVARASVASSFLSAKTLAQGLVLLLHSFIVPDGRRVAMDYASTQLVPAMLINAVIAFGVPYSISN
jgi:hypothetical protein